ncbi:oxidoreductase [Roseovarius ramblicola]|uniref:Oxidoreductase n=1 Tax=Roseovarius ramblicola TaxID=2022336 RepID=A0ABV5HZ80_9RHOB
MRRKVPTLEAQKRGGTMPHRIVAIIKVVRALGLCLAAVLAAPGPAAQARDAARLVILAADGTQLAALDRAALAALPQTEFTTRTIWTEGPQHFLGVSLAELLARHDLGAVRLDLVALNDYTVSLPARAIGPVYPVIAHTRNGEPMSLRDKGPFWLLWNFDSNPDFRRETVYTRSIWQLDRITVYPAAE